MKYLLFFLLLFVACQKDERFFWKCIQTTISQAPGQKCPDVTSEVKYPTTMMTKEEIIAFKRFYTAEGYVIQDGDTLRYKSDCQCWKLTCVKDSI